MCVVRSLYHVVNNKIKNHKRWSAAMTRAKAHAQEIGDKDFASTYAAAGSLLDIREGKRTTPRRKRKPPAKFEITVGMPKSLFCSGHAQVQLLVVGMPKVFCL